MEELIKRLHAWYQTENIQQDDIILNDAQQMSLHALFSTWYEEQLIRSGNNPEHIKQEYRKLALCFHPDKLQNLDAAVLRANHLLANNSQTPLFACLLYTKELCLQKLEHSTEQSQSGKSQRNFVEDMLQQLEKRAERTRFEGKRQILLQAVDMLRTYQKKAAEEQYKEAAISLISKGFPFAVTAFCVMSYMPQCLALLAMTKLASVGGDYIHELSGARAEYLGDSLKKTSEALQRAGLGLFSAVIASYLQGIRLTGNAMKQVWSIEAAPTDNAELVFKNQDIAKIVRPLGMYLDEVKAQWGLPFRKGADKQQLVFGVLQKIKMLDDEHSEDWPSRLKTLLDELAASRLIRSQKGKCAMRIGESLTRFKQFAPEIKEQMALVLRQ